MRQFIFALILIGTLHSFSFGRDYYVSTSGNDRNAGSKEQPLRTIQRGLQIAQQPGDRVIVREGTYPQTRTLNMPNNGTDGNFIELLSYKNEKVILDGKDLAKNSRSIIIALNHHIRIKGLIIQNSVGSGIAIYGPSERVNHVELIGNEIRGSFESGVQVGWNQPKQAPKNILLENNSIHHNNSKNKTSNNTNISEKARRLGGRAIPWGSAIGGISHGLTIRKNRVFQNWGEGIGVYLSDNIKIVGNTVFDNFSVNVYLDNTTNSVVERNFVYSSGDKDFYRHGHPASGIQIANEKYGNLINRSDRNTIINNILVDNYFAFYMAGYQHGGGMKNTLFANNTCCGSTGSLLHIDADQGHSNSRIANNIFIERPGGKIADVAGPTKGINFRNNLWFGGKPIRNIQSESDLFVDPSFAGRNRKTAESYRLKMNSPAIHKGIRIDEIKIDFSGKNRGRKINLGAW